MSYTLALADLVGHQPPPRAVPASRLAKSWREPVETQICREGKEENCPPPPLCGLGPQLPTDVQPASY